MAKSTIKLRAKEKGGEVTLKALITHPMETGARKDSKTGELIPAHFIQEVVCKANDQTVIQCEPASLWSGRPLVRNARLIKLEGAVYGIGVLEKALAEIDTIQAIHNQNIDATNCVIQPEYEVNQNGLVDGIMRASGPGARHYVYEKGTINAIVKNFQGLPIGERAVQAAIQRFERVTGAVDTASGSDESATRTARNTNIINTKLGAHVRAVEDELISPAVNMQLELNAQYVDAEQVFVITQDEKARELRLSPDMVRRGAIAYAAGSKYLAEKQERVMNLMTGLQLVNELKASGQPTPVDVLFQPFRQLVNRRYVVCPTSHTFIFSDFEFTVKTFLGSYLLYSEWADRGCT